MGEAGQEVVEAIQGRYSRPGSDFNLIPQGRSDVSVVSPSLLQLETRELDFQTPTPVGL